jgi:cell division transport system ATP-binding protein
LSSPLSAPYIAYEHVEVRYSDLVTGLRDFSLQIQRGEFVFFVGRTGAGKSTLLKLLTREVRHTGGKIRLRERDLGEVRERDIAGLRREMGIVPQDFALLPQKKVWENVAYAMRAVGHNRKEVRRKVPEILERVNIAHRADAFPHQLSGGEQQRVAIARALINNPPLLLADEPTGNLDPDHSWEIMELLASLNLRGTTVLVASHDMMVVQRMGKRIVTLDEGHLMSDVVPEPEPLFVIPSPVEEETAPHGEVAAEDPVAALAEEDVRYEDLLDAPLEPPVEAHAEVEPPAQTPQPALPDVQDEEAANAG